MKKSLRAFVVALTLWAIPLPLLAAEQGLLSDWGVFGTNTARVEYYNNSGNPSAPIYPSEDFQGFNELSIDFSKRLSTYETMRGYGLGLYNESDFRSDESGFLFENLNFTWEKGDTFLPFRAEAGDFFGFYSYRTLQQSLKGLQIELQPRTVLSQSLVLTAGINKPVYRDLDENEDLYLGASWLIEPTGTTSLGFNFVQNRREADGALPDRHQSVFSLLAEQHLALGSHNLTLEGEVAYFDGDTETGSDGLSSDKSEAGYFAQLSGESGRPLDYRFRFEQYGENYRPNGAVVTADRRSLEAHGGWRFVNGLYLSGRLQAFRDALESANPVDTETAGLRLTGPLVPGAAMGGSAALDGFVQSRESRDGTTDNLTWNLNANLAAGLTAGWNGRLGLFWQSREDNAANSQQETYQVILGAERPIDAGRLRGTIGPSLLFRARRGSNSDQDEYGPSLALGLERDRHSLRLNYFLLAQFAQEAATRDNLVNSAALAYSYVIRNHRITLEADYEGRDPEDDPSSEGSRIALSYTYTFDKPQGRPISLGLPAAEPPKVAARITADIVSLAPGLDLEAARAGLTAAGITGAVEQPSTLIYETPMLPSIIQRQRLVLVHEAGRITTSTILINFDDVGNQDSTRQTFERVREALVQRYGNPDRTFAEGEFSENLARDVNRSRLIRISEWQVEERGILRLGIPRRLDRQVRIEIQFASRFPPPRQTLWSLEGVP